MPVRGGGGGGGGETPDPKMSLFYGFPYHINLTVVSPLFEKIWLIMEEKCSDSGLTSEKDDDLCSWPWMTLKLHVCKSRSQLSSPSCSASVFCCQRPCNSLHNFNSSYFIIRIDNYKVNRTDLILFHLGGGRGEGRSAPNVFNQGKKHLFQTPVSRELSDWDA